MSPSSPSSSSTPEPPTKRKRTTKIQEPQSDDDSDSASSSSSSSSESEAEDAPPLSHAEKRRQKKKEKLAQKKGKDGKEPPFKKRKLADGTPSTTSEGNLQRQNSIWVGNLSFKTTPADLRTFFEGVGEITRIHMPMKPGMRPGMKGENRGFAYVDFATPDAKVIAVTLSERPLTGRKLLIKDGNDFTGRPTTSSERAADKGQGTSLSKTAQKILNVQKQPPAPTLFIGNLGFETTEDQIKELLEAHRKKSKKEKDQTDETIGGADDAKTDESESWIRKIRMGTFEDSGLCKGFAFVDFSTIENATSALVNPRNHHLNGRNLVVEYASVDAVRRGPNKQHVGGREGKQKTSKTRDPSTGRQRPEKKFSEKGTSEAITRDSVPRPEGQDDVRGQEGNADHRKRTGKGPDAPRQKGPRHRPKPGAALAQAKRQSAAIVPTTGKKIVF
ncbi:hypothetical protein L218DRAFT_922729 [Marasmius fiardii PR-910]|nr:hypothetical protein L218DRAFT_922729 [Marasmius fiardii PR-910]